MLKTVCRLLIASALVVTMKAEAPGVYALTGGTVHPVNVPAIERGTVVIRGGLIEAVGSNVTVPADATIIDVSGMHVYPGLIDAHTSVGLPPPPKPSRTPFYLRAPSEPKPGEPVPSPRLMASEILKLTDDAMNARRSTGVTTVLTTYTEGIFNGQAAVVDLGGGESPHLVVRDGVAEQISFQTSRDGSYPLSLMGVVADIRQTMLDAQHAGLAEAIYAKDPRGKKRPADSPELDALAPALRAEMPVIFVANEELMMRRAEGIAKEFKLRWILAGGMQAYRSADYIAGLGVPVLFSVDYPKPPREEEDKAVQPLREIRDRVLSPTGPAELAKRKVRFALVSGAEGMKVDFVGGIRKAIENGLSEGDAVRAVTIWPATILGVDRQLGSLERGKIANVVVSSAPIFDEGSKIEHVFVDGRRIDLPKEKEKNDEGGRKRGSKGPGEIEGVTR